MAAMNAAAMDARVVEAPARPPSRGGQEDMDWMRAQLRQAKRDDAETANALDVQRDVAQTAAATRIQAASRGRKSR